MDFDTKTENLDKEFETGKITKERRYYEEKTLKSFLPCSDSVPASGNEADRDIVR